MVLENHLLLAGEAALVAMVEGREPIVEGLVESDVVAVRGKKRKSFFHNCIEGVAAVGFGHVEEHAGNLFKQQSAEFVGGNGVLESGRLGIGRNSVDGFLLLAYSFLDRGKVIAHLDLVVGRDSVGSVPLFKERIGVAGREHKEC